MSLHLDGSNSLMKKLQLLFAFLAHTQVCFLSVCFRMLQGVCVCAFYFLNKSIKNTS